MPRLKAWVDKKLKELLGMEEPALSSHIISKVQARASAQVGAAGTGAPGGRMHARLIAFVGGGGGGVAAGTVMGLQRSRGTAQLRSACRR
jgi:hypothetical protein